MKTANNKSTGGLPSKIGKNFHEAIEKIKDEKLRNGTLKERLSTERLTNLIIRHKNWEEIALHIIEADQEEIEKYGI